MSDNEGSHVKKSSVKTNGKENKSDNNGDGVVNRKTISPYDICSIPKFEFKK
jgi:hypothetical protein